MVGLIIGVSMIKNKLLSKLKKKRKKKEEEKYTHQKSQGLVLGGGEGQSNNSGQGGMG